MDIAVSRPLSKRLAEEPENDSRQAPERNQRHISHDGRNEARLSSPWRDELAESVTPHVLVDRNGHEDGASYGLVRIDGIRRCDGGQGSNLDTRAGVTNDNDGLLQCQNSEKIASFRENKAGTGTFP